MKEQTTELAVAATKKAVSALEHKSKAISVKNDDELTSAVDFLASLATASKVVKYQKEEITKPLNEALKNVRALFSPIEQSLENSTTYVKGLVMKYQQSVMAKAQKKEEAIADKVEQGKMSFEKGVEKIDQVKRIDTTVQSKSGSVTFRTNKVVEVIDESQVPDDFWVLDMVKIRNVAKSGIAIPGVQVREEKVPVIGTNSY